MTKFLLKNSNITILKNVKIFQMKHYDSTWTINIPVHAVIKALTHCKAIPKALSIFFGRDICNKTEDEVRSTEGLCEWKHTLTTRGDQIGWLT